MTAPIKLSDAIRFFQAKGVSRKCLSCGHEECEVTDENRANLLLVLPGFPFGNYDINSATLIGLCGLACANCGYMRLFRRSVIQDWVASNPEGSAI